MNWRLLENSIGVAAFASAIAAIAGCTIALWARTLSDRGRNMVHLTALAALALPPFFITNAWMQLLGVGGLLTPWMPISLFSLSGGVLLLSLLYWPIPYLASISAWMPLTHELLEVDLQLRGVSLLRHLLWPMIRRPVAIGCLLTLVLALNQFSVPSLLQIKVLPAEVWVAYSTQLDTLSALRVGWPLIALPMLFVLIWRPVAFPAINAAERSGTRLFRQQIGCKLGIALGVFSTAWLMLSVLLPLLATVQERRTWEEFFPSGAANIRPILNSLGISIGTATAVMLLGVSMHLLLVRMRWRRFNWAIEGLLWFAFFVPGLFPSMGLIHLCSSSTFSGLQGSVLLSPLLLVFRYLAIGWQAAQIAVLALDPDLVDAASLGSLSPWGWFRHVLWAQQGALLAGAWYGIYVLTLWDVESQILLQAPGGETLALRIFNLLHYGHNNQVNALCIHLLLIAAIPLLVWQGARWSARWHQFARWKTTLFWIALVGFTGCSPEPSPKSTTLKSSLFRTVEIVGTRGTAAGQFNKPRSLTVDRADNLYVVDMTGRVQKFSPEGRFLLLWQLPQTDLGKPKGMTCDQEGQVVVVEPHYQRVNHFTSSGELLRQWGSSGTNQGQLTLPRSVAVNSKGILFLTEYTTVDRVQGFQATNAVWKLLFGHAGNGPGAFNRAEGITVDPQDRLYVADSCNHRVQVFTPDGVFLRAYGKAGSGSGELSYPYDVKLDREGRQYVCEFGNSRIQVFDAQDHPIEILGSYGNAPGEFSNPWSIAMDSKGNLYVADAGNHRVQKFVRR